MSVEVLTYRLEARGAPAGRHVLRTDVSGRHARLESEARFEGPLPQAEVVQLSRCLSDDGVSVGYQERTQDRGGARGFRIEFDDRAGLVRFVKTDGDTAETPYLQAFRDPLSMLHALRRAPADAERIRLPLLGKTVEARALGATDLTTELGPKRARAYQLHPGGSWIWIDVAPPHAIVKFAQRTPDGRIDALLASIAHETVMPRWDDEGDDGGRKNRARRRKRRRRGRGGRSRGGKGEAGTGGGGRDGDD